MGVIHERTANLVGDDREVIRKGLMSLLHAQSKWKICREVKTRTDVDELQICKAFIAPIRCCTLLERLGVDLSYQGYGPSESLYLSLRSV